MFTGTASIGEPVLDFAKSAANENINIWRSGITKMSFAIFNGGSACTVATSNTMLQNNWLTIVAKYPSATMTMELRVGSVVDVQTNTALRTDRSVDLTYIGRSSRAQDPYLSGKIAGLYALDALLSDVEISELSNKIY